jgi:dienelactone hydrolase
MTARRLLQRATAHATAAAAATIALAIGPAMATSRTAAAGRVEQILRIPEPRSGVLMQARLLKPTGPGLFPLAIVNHGSAESAAARAEHELPSFEPLTGWLLSQGFAVLIPQRPGHGATGGPYRESAGVCESADFLSAGQGTADAIEAALAHMQSNRTIRPGGAVLLGHSAGAWGALALASRGVAGIAAVVAFAPGRGGYSYGYPNRNCSPERLIATAAHFGRTSRARTLWLYARNDTFFGPQLSGALAAAFRGAGGHAEYHLLPEIGQEGHFIAFSPVAMTQWAPIVRRFLRH